MDAIPLTSEQWAETAAAAVVLGVMIVVAWGVPMVAGALARRWPAELGARVLRALSGPVGGLLAVQALFILLHRLSYLQSSRTLIERTWLAFTIFVVVYATQRLVAPLTEWYAGRSERSRSRLHSLPPIQRALRGVIWVAGLLTVLATIGIEISPLLAGLGLGGLAVALALQPMLTNVFASSYLLSDQSIRIGDSIQVQGGPSGVIEDIGWRATRIRSVDNNIVLVPNSVLAQSTMTNFDATASETDVTLLLHVSAEEDLERVEEVCLDELSRLCGEATGLVVAGAPISFRYQAIDAGKAEIMLRIRATSWQDVVDLRHRMIRRLHSRLQSEGIKLV